MLRRPLVSLSLVVALAGSASASMAVLGTPQPVSSVTYAGLGSTVRRPIVVANGDRALVVFDRAEGAVRIDENGKPLDIPAILLPKPAWTSGADVVADGDGWIIGWTVFSFPGEQSSLRVVRVTRDGAVSDPEDHRLPRLVPQNEELHLAIRNGVLLAAHPLDRQEGSKIAIDDPEHPDVTVTVDGELRELIATEDGFALVLRDRIVRLTPDGTPAGDIALPPDFAPTDVTRTGDDLILGGTTPDEIAVARLRKGADAVVIIARIDALSTNARVAVKDGEIVVLYTATATQPLPYASTFWDLRAARIGTDGRIEGPLRLRMDVYVSGRWVPPVDVPEIEIIQGSFVAVWTEGFASAFFPARNVYAATFDALHAIDAPQLVTWRAVDQWLVGSAVSGNTRLVVWNEPDPSGLFTQGRCYARRFAVDGRILDADKFPLSIHPTRVVATDDGFLAWGNDGREVIREDGTRRSEPNVPEIRDVACSGETCIAALVEKDALFFAPWRAGALDPSRVPVHSGAGPYEVSIAVHGPRFYLAFSRAAVPGGTILALARIDPSGESWTYRLSDFAASPMTLENLRIVPQRDRMLALWHNYLIGHRASHLTFDGDSMDGAETGWEGWSIPLDGFVAETAVDDSRTLLLTGSGPWRLYEISGRTALLVAQLGVDRASIACASGRGCAVASQRTMLGGPWYRASRVFLQSLQFSKPRAVRH